MLALTSLLLLLLPSCAREEAPANRLNVVFIIAEDLRPELAVNAREPFEDIGAGVGGAVATPHVDRLAARSLVFDLAVAQVAVCAPSRASLLTGLRPDTLGIYDFQHFGAMRHFRTLLSHYNSKGYITSGSGKIFHYEASHHYSHHYYGDEWESLARAERRFQNSSVTPDALHGDGFFRDARIVGKAIEFLDSMHAQSERARSATGRALPWFLAVGLKGTHMPYHMPTKYHELYLGRAIRAGDAARLSFPPGAPLLHYSTKPEGARIDFMSGNGSRPWRERESYLQNVNGDPRRARAVKRISARGHAELYKGYLACLSYADSQLGRLLNRLDALGLWDSTVVVFTADHGMHLGEKGMWTKWTLFDEAARVPLLVHSPLHSRSHGQHYVHPVELIDLLPTLVELTNTPLETACPPARAADAAPRGRRGVMQHSHCDPLDGVSLVPAFTTLNSLDRRGNPHTGADKPLSRGAATGAPILEYEGAPALGKSFGLTQKMTCKLPGFKDTDPSSPGWIDFCPFKSLPRDPPAGAMGYSLRFINYRYTAWLAFDTDSFLPALSAPPLAEELYSHAGRFSDSGQLDFLSGARSIGWAELVNLANDSAHHFVLRAARRALYDFLWGDASHEHLYFKRVAHDESMLAIHTRRHHSRRPHNSSAHYYAHY